MKHTDDLLRMKTKKMYSTRTAMAELSEKKEKQATS